MTPRPSPTSPPPPHQRRESPSPNPNPPETPSPSTPAATRSASSSAGSSAAEFIADAGPAFDPRQAPAAPLVEEPELEVDEWDEERIREILTLAGEVTHSLFNAGPEDDETWLATDRDLRAMVPPATRIANRYDVIRAAAAAGDEALLAAAMTRYVARNYTRRRRILKLREVQGPQPITGTEALPETGPEYDAEWQRIHGGEAIADVDTSIPDLPARGAHKW
jgi:hypothetical protein